MTTTTKKKLKYRTKICKKGSEMDNDVANSSKMWIDTKQLTVDSLEKLTLPTKCFVVNFRSNIL